MDRLNLPASILNLPNVEKLQHRESHHPVNISINNSVVDKDRFDEEHRQTTEVESGTGIPVDPDGKREQDKKEKKKQKESNKPDGKNRGSNSGKFIDFSA